MLASISETGGVVVVTVGIGVTLAATVTVVACGPVPIFGVVVVVVAAVFTSGLFNYFICLAVFDIIFDKSRF